MTFEEFYTEYRKHDGEKPRKKQGKFEGYTLTYRNGDKYEYRQELKPNAKKHGGRYGGEYWQEDFIGSAYWNGELIEKAK